jgi:presequence protease
MSRTGPNESDWADEQMSGVSYLFFLRKLADDIEINWDGVLAALERIRSTLVNRAAMLCNVTAEAGPLAQLTPQLASFLGALPRTVAKAVPWRVADGPTFRRPHHDDQGQLRWQGR